MLAFLAKFANGSLAIFESTRYARGHKAILFLKLMVLMVLFFGICMTFIAWITSSMTRKIQRPVDGAYSCN